MDRVISEAVMIVGPTHELISNFIGNVNQSQNTHLTFYPEFAVNDACDSGTNDANYVA